MFPAKIISTDVDNDLALLKVNGKFSPVHFQKARTAKIGQTIFTVGFPRPMLQGFSPKVTKGVVSSLSGMEDDARHLQIDAAIQPGNSGGPIANESGEVVGVVVSMLNSQKTIQTGDQVPQNVNYGIKKSYILAFLDNVPKCADQVQEGKPQSASFEDVVASLIASTALVICY